MGKIRFSVNNLTISKLDLSDFELLKSFTCGVETLDKFFHDEIALCAKYHYLSPYSVKHDGEIVAVFTLSNDSIMLESEDKDDFPNVNEEYSHIFPQQSSFPAVNIGHLGVKSGMQSCGIGEMVIRYVWFTFSEFTAAGCQFITVDSLNNPRVNKFYAGLGFEYQSSRDQYNTTRRMYLDIFTK